MKASIVFAILLAFSSFLHVSGADKRVLLIAGKPSHGPGDHEFRAGCLLLQRCLRDVPGLTVEVYTNGWPQTDDVFQGADAVVIYSDGGAGHPAIQGDRMKEMDALAAKGVGIGCMHYAVEVPKGPAGQAMWRWIGGYYEDHYSCNPMWIPDYQSFPSHPVTRGVKPFAVLDEWYFNMRWAPGPLGDSATQRAQDLPPGLTPILVAKPSDKVRRGPYVYPAGPYDHIVAASGREETMLWTFERPDGGRGFGFTGGHRHVNWFNDNERKVVLNSILWIAKMEVPEGGVDSKLNPEDLAMNLDAKGQSASAPNLTGHWAVHVESANGSWDPTFSFVQAGQNLLGEYKGGLGEATVNGSISKDQSVHFSFTVQRDGQELPVAYTGRVVGSDHMEGKVKVGEGAEGTWDAKR